MQSTTDFAVWATLIIALFSLGPKIASIATRRRGQHERHEIDRFQAVLEAQDSQLKDCRTECERYRLRAIEAERRASELEGMLLRRGWRDERRVPRGENHDS